MEHVAATISSVFQYFEKMSNRKQTKKFQVGKINNIF
jgi:hypothetical protein